MSATHPKLEHPGLLPAVLVPEPARDERAGATQLERTTRDWIVDVLIFAVAVAAGVLFVFDTGRSQTTPQWLMLLDLFWGSLACVALWWRRRWPVAIALLIVPISAFSVMSAGASLVALFTVAVHRPFRSVALVGGLGLATLPIYLHIHPEEGIPYWVMALLVTMMTVATVAWGMFVRARRQLVLSLRERVQRAEAEQQLRVEQARIEERARIAREMHDVLAHRISLLSLHAGALEFRADASPDEVTRAAGVIRESAHHALEDLRQVIGVLRGDAGLAGEPEPPQPTLADLPTLVDESRRVGTLVHTDYRLSDLTAVPETTGRNAYRIVQEALTNARKHAPGSPVELCIDGRVGQGVELALRNRLPLRAESTEIPGAGRGLVGLSERASLAGGRLEHGRTASGDFRLWAWLPWPS